MSADERLKDSLAERLYRAHQDWRHDLSPSAAYRPLWWALHADLKADYLKAAEQLLAVEGKRV